MAARHVGTLKRGQIILCQLTRYLLEEFLKRKRVEMRLKKHYDETVKKSLQEKFSYKSSMQIPRVTKIVLNAGVGEAVQNSKAMNFVEYAMTQISGQKPIITKAKKSIATFKLREGQAIGCCVTLRGARMFDFMDKLISVALPRTKDFKGISPKGFDGRGNFTFGIKEQIIFPEINVDKLDKIRGLNVTFVTTANTNEEAKALLWEMGLPMRGLGDVVQGV